MFSLYPPWSLWFCFTHLWSEQTGTQTFTQVCSMFALWVSDLRSLIWSVSGVSEYWESDWWPREVLASYIQRRRLLTLVTFSETCFGHQALTTHYPTWKVQRLLLQNIYHRIRFEPFALFLAFVAHKRAVRRQSFQTLLKIIKLSKRRKQ